MKILGLHVLTSAQFVALKGFALGEIDKAVAAAKTTELGAAIVSIVKSVEDPTLTGVEKMSRALAAAMPVVRDNAGKGGLAVALEDTEQFARHLIESTLADLKQTPAARIAAALLKLFGVG